MKATDLISAAAAEAKPSRRKRKNLSERRSDLRENLWPGSEKLIWTRKSHDGFTTIPRLLPLIASLAKKLAKGSDGDPSSVYYELWARSTDEGILQIKDEQECAYAAGYLGARAHRTWKERMGTLVELGLVKARASGNREYATILLINPLLAAAQLRADKRKKVPDEWWTAFQSRADEVGAEVPTASGKQPHPF